MTIRVESEIGPLKRVLVHRPGKAIDWMAPSRMERLLFDDILDSRQARREHDSFCRVLQKAGAETLDPEELLAEVLEDGDAREQVLAVLQRRYGLASARVDSLEGLDPEELAAVTIRGLRTEGPPIHGRERRFFDLDPLPNYFFQRDPLVVIGNRVVVSAMATEAREREPYLSRLIFDRHPRLADYEDLFQIDSPTSWDAERELGYPYPQLEGGDVLIASPEVLLIGVSARTNMQGAELLAEYLRSNDTSFRRVLLVQLPSKRSYMHLDTVFTFIDRGTCLAFLPVVEAGGAESARVYSIDLTAEVLSLTPRPSLKEALAEADISVSFVPCGGGEDLISQYREQWTDGANAFAVAPGVITLYRRNRATVEELERRGWRVLRDEEALADGVELVGQGPTVVTLQSNELSRARGGPRCMTMPLERGPVV
jgi:arginine deiminase